MKLNLCRGNDDVFQENIGNRFAFSVNNSGKFLYFPAAVSKLHRTSPTLMKCFNVNQNPSQKVQ